MFGQLAIAALVGVAVFLIALLLLPALSLSVTPWAAVLGLLSALVVYFGRGRL